jgi:hypothetical protein
MSTVGGEEGSFTVMVILSIAIPPNPVAVMLKVVVSVGDIWTEPFGATLPIPGSRKQDSAEVELQVRVDDSPATIISGSAAIVTVGSR